MLSRCIAAIILVSSWALYAASPVASADAAGSFILSGVTVPKTATVSVPVISGDEISALDSPVRLTFGDNSRFVLDRKATVRIQNGTLRVLRGSVRYELGPASTLAVLADRTPMHSRNGIASVGSSVTPLTRPLPRTIVEVKPPKRSKQCPHADSDDHDCGKGNDNNE
jgi:hypothetical protein